MKIPNMKLIKIITEEDSEGESDQKAVREPTKKKSKVGPLSKCPPEFK